MHHLTFTHRTFKREACTIQHENPYMRYQLLKKKKIAQPPTQWRGIPSAFRQQNALLETSVPTLINSCAVLIAT